MKFADLPAGERVFLDANPLVHYFAPDPNLGPSCRALLARIQIQQIEALTSTHVLSEVAHHLMTLEAARRFNWTSRIVTHLKQQPTRIQQLTGFRTAIDSIARLHVQVLTVHPDWIATAARLSQQHGLLSNDALIVAIMQAHGLTHLASQDSDFDRVPGLTRYAPG